jgi:hypothetical protein
VQEVCQKLKALFEFLMIQFGSKGFTDTAYDRMGAVSGGFLKTSLRNRGPYLSASAEDVQALRQWYKDNFPEMLKL